MTDESSFSHTNERVRGHQVRRMVAAERLAIAKQLEQELVAAGASDIDLGGDTDVADWLAGQRALTTQKRPS